MNTIGVSDRCGPLGSISAPQWLALPPGGLSTYKTAQLEYNGPYPVNSGLIANIFEKNPRELAPLVAPLDVRDFKCPTFGFGKTQIRGLISTTIGPPWQPILVPPLEIFALNPVWHSVCTAVFTNINEFLRGLYDPPKSLVPGQGLIPDGTPSQPTPESTSTHEPLKPAPRLDPPLPTQTKSLPQVQTDPTGKKGAGAPDRQKPRPVKEPHGRSSDQDFHPKSHSAYKAGGRPGPVHGDQQHGQPAPQIPGEEQGGSKSHQDDNVDPKSTPSDLSPAVDDPLGSGPTSGDATGDPNSNAPGLSPEVDGSSKTGPTGGDPKMYNMGSPGTGPIAGDANGDPDPDPSDPSSKADESSENHPTAGDANGDPNPEFNKSNHPSDTDDPSEKIPSASGAVLHNMDPPPPPQEGPQPLVKGASGKVIPDEEGPAPESDAPAVGQQEANPLLPPMNEESQSAAGTNLPGGEYPVGSKAVQGFGSEATLRGEAVSAWPAVAQITGLSSLLSPPGMQRYGQNPGYADPGYADPKDLPSTLPDGSVPEISDSGNPSDPLHNNANGFEENTNDYSFAATDDTKNPYPLPSSYNLEDADPAFSTDLGYRPLPDGSGNTNLEGRTNSPAVPLQSADLKNIDNPSKPTRPNNDDPPPMNTGTYISSSNLSDFSDLLLPPQLQTKPDSTLRDLTLSTEALAVDPPTTTVGSNATITNDGETAANSIATTTITSGVIITDDSSTDNSDPKSVKSPKTSSKHTSHGVRLHIQSSVSKVCAVAAIIMSSTWTFSSFSSFSSLRLYF